MPRILAPIVYYKDAQWRALKSKAKNNHPSLEPEDRDIINEVARVNDAIVNNTDPKPRPEFESSIKMDDRQVVKFFLWSIIKIHDGEFTLIRTFYLPTRRPDGRGGKHQKTAEMLVRPRRDSTGNTNGFVRRPVKNIVDIAEKEIVEDDGATGEAMMSGALTSGETGDINGGANEDAIVVTSGPTNSSPSGGRAQKGRAAKKQRHSHEFVRRSQRVIGGAVEKERIELIRTISDELADEDTGEVKDPVGSSSPSDTIMADDTPAAEDASNNTYVSPYQRTLISNPPPANATNTIYMSPFDNPLSPFYNGMPLSQLNSSYPPNTPSPSRPYNPELSPYIQSMSYQPMSFPPYPPLNTTYTSPYGPTPSSPELRRRGSQSTISAVSIDFIADLEEDEVEESGEREQSRGLGSPNESVRADPMESVNEPLESESVEMDWEA